MGVSLGHSTCFRDHFWETDPAHLGITSLGALDACSLGPYHSKSSSLKTASLVFNRALTSAISQAFWLNGYNPGGGIIPIFRDEDLSGLVDCRATSLDHTDSFHGPVPGFLFLFW